MTPSDEHGQARQQLLALAGRRKARRYDWPRDWRPRSVRDPETGDLLSDEGAWEVIMRALEEGTPLHEVVLDNPPGRKAYTMDIPSQYGTIYVKLRLGSGYVLAKSFHYSERQ